MLDIIEKALKNGQKTLSEYESRLVIESAGVPVVPAALVKTRQEAICEAAKIGFPLVMKGCSAELAHKTEAGMVALNICNIEEVAAVFEEFTDKAKNLDGCSLRRW